MNTVLILAAGDQRRWSEDAPKQLVNVGGELLIRRTVRQVKARGGDPVVVTHHPLIMAAAIDVARIYLPQYRRWLLETLYQTRPLWDGQMVALLGDVCFSGAAMDMILKETRPGIRLYGTAEEIFALRFTPADDVSLYVPYADAGAQTAEVDVGRMWNLYRSLSGLPLRKRVVPLRDGDPVFAYVDDWTRDFDLPNQYEVFKVMVLDAELLDDLPEATHV